MKFQRADLITRVKAEIERRKQAMAEHNAEAAQKHEEARLKYLEATSPAWGELATTIRRRLRNNQPITTDDIPEELRTGRNYGYVAMWDSKSPTDRVADTRHLDALLECLESATDEVISASSLERLGFRMAQIFPAR